MTEPIVIGFAVVGFVVTLIFLCNALREIAQGLKAHLIPMLFQDQIGLDVKYGKWAVVTGSTDGIGQEYAKALAKRGLNIVLISRNIDKLNTTASEIEREHKVETKIIQADFSIGKQVFDHISKELSDMEIGILVNNVGVTYPYPMYFDEVPESMLWGMVNVNIGAASHMTKLVLPRMQKRKRGAIVNVSSTAELFPIPLEAMYGASKVYMKSFTEALRMEYAKDNITVQHLSPSFVKTKMTAFSRYLQTISLFIPDAKTYATNAVNTLGKVNHTTGYWPHGIQYFFIRLVPMWLRADYGEVLTKSFRRNYLKRNGLKFE